jgi:hypothetical protein
LLLADLPRTPQAEKERTAGSERIRADAEFQLSLACSLHNLHKLCGRINGLHARLDAASVSSASRPKSFLPGSGIRHVIPDSVQLAFPPPLCRWRERTTQSAAKDAPHSIKRWAASKHETNITSSDRRCFDDQMLANLSCQMSVFLRADLLI